MPDPFQMQLRRRRRRSLAGLPPDSRVDSRLRAAFVESTGQLVLFPRGCSHPEELPYALVPPAKARGRAIALAALRWCARDLGIPMPKLHFFVRLDMAPAFGARELAFLHRDRIRGLAYPDAGVIFVSAALPKREMVEVTAHEAWHVATSGMAAGAHQELGAQRYGRRIARSEVARDVAGRGRWQRQRRALPPIRARR